MVQQSPSWASTWRKPLFKSACTPMFTAALFTIARTQKHPKCSSIEEWIKRCGTYRQCSISHKKEQNTAICRDTVGPIDCHIE